MPFEPHTTLNFIVMGETPANRPAYAPLGVGDEDAKVINVATTHEQLVISTITEYVNGVSGLRISAVTNDFWRATSFFILFDRSKPAKPLNEDEFDPARMWNIENARNAVFETLARVNIDVKPNTRKQPMPGIARL